MIWQFEPLTQMFQSCDGCSGDLSIEHALSCRFGGLVIHRHNKVRDTINDLTSFVWGNVICEPVVFEQCVSTDGALVTDLCV